MDQPRNHPGDEDLRDFASGRLVDAERVEHHIAQCEPCARRIDLIAAELQDAFLNKLKANTPSDRTCWVLIKEAAKGEPHQRAEFAQRYNATIRAYLNARWKQSAVRAYLDDATQEVFVECLRQDGLLQRASEAHPGGFRAFLFGATRNVARRFEERDARSKEHQHGTAIIANRPDDDPSLSQHFDRAYATRLLRDAFALYERRSLVEGGEMRQRVTLLRRRFQDEVPVRDIAQEWKVDAKRLHRKLDRAKQEFREAVLDVLRSESPGATGAELNESCREILSMVSSRR